MFYRRGGPMLAPVQTISARGLFARLLAAFCIAGFSSQALASGNRCAAIFEPETLNFRLSENYRLELLANAKALSKLITRERMDATIEFQLQLERRDELTPSRIRRDFESSQTLSHPNMQAQTQEGANTVSPPKIHFETMDLMQNMRADLELVAERMRRDPYFTWLKHYSLRYEASQKDNLRAVNRLLAPPPFQANPITLFVAYRKEGLSPDLALIRVMRNLDPVISPSAFLAADIALNRSELENILNDKVLPYLTERNSHGKADPWLLMLSRQGGLRQLRFLLDQQAGRYGKMFSRTSYQRVLSRLENKDPALDVISEYFNRRVKRVPEQEIVTGLEPRLRALADQLGISRDFPIARLYDMVDRISLLNQVSSYEAILADIFDPPTGVLIRELRTITEIAEGFSTQKQAEHYLQGLIEP
jgi:hypothetical protein